MDERIKIAILELFEKRGVFPRTELDPLLRTTFIYVSLGGIGLLSSIVQLSQQEYLKMHKRGNEVWAYSIEPKGLRYLADHRAEKLKTAKSEKWDRIKKIISIISFIVLLLTFIISRDLRELLLHIWRLLRHE